MLPEDDRGASALSPYVRHGLIGLPELWAHVGDGPAADRRKYRDELLWQEYARHVHARLGHRDTEALALRRVTGRRAVGAAVAG